MNRRGFTLIETLLAASLGALVVLVALGIMESMDRTQVLIERRHKQVDRLAQLHLVMNRVFSSLVMADQNTTAPQGQNNGSNRQPGAPVGNTASTDATAGLPPVIDPGLGETRPRFLLITDSKVSRKSIVHFGGKQEAAQPQKLEVVLMRSPIPPGWGRALTSEVMAASDATAATRTGMAAYRGAFELRPDTATPREFWSVLGEPVPGAWTLWWRPLPSTSSANAGDPFTLDALQDPAAVPVVSGLVKCTWLAFKTVSEKNKTQSRQMLNEITATAFTELPAYVDMQVQLADGMTADWMFEVGWSNGPETSDEAEEQGTDGSGGAVVTTNGSGNDAGRGRGPGAGRGGPGAGQGPGSTMGRQQATPMGSEAGGGRRGGGR